MLQRHPFGFWNQPEGHTDKGDVQRGIQPERTRRADGIQQRQEGSPDNHIRHPVGGGGTGDTEIAAFQRLDFRAQDPHHRCGAHGVTGDAHHRHPHRQPGEPVWCRAVIKLHQTVAQHQRPHGHHAKAVFQRRFAPGFIHGEHGDKGGKHKGQANHQRGDHLLFRGGEPGHFKDARRVVHDDIHAGELLHRL